MRASSDQAKNDKRDALNLARMLSLGQVTAGQVPTEDCEALRDLALSRQRAAKDLLQAKQRVNLLLSRHGFSIRKSRNVQVPI